MVRGDRSLWRSHRWQRNPQENLESNSESFTLWNAQKRWDVTITVKGLRCERSSNRTTNKLFMDIRSQENAVLGKSLRVGTLPPSANTSWVGGLKGMEARILSKGDSTSGFIELIACKGLTFGLSFASFNCALVSSNCNCRLLCFNCSSWICLSSDKGWCAAGVVVSCAFLWLRALGLLLISCCTR